MGLKRHGFELRMVEKIFGLKYDDEIEGIIGIALSCWSAFTVREMDYIGQGAEIKMVSEAKL